jgi:hypothetical protein
MTTHRAKLDTDVQALVERSLGKEKRADPKEFENISKPFIDANQLKLIDPLNIDTLIEKMKKDIETFETDVDVVLSEANSTIFLEI